MKRCAMISAGLLVLAAFWIAVRSNFGDGSVDPDASSDSRGKARLVYGTPVDPAADRPVAGNHAAAIESALHELRHDDTDSTMALEHLRSVLFQGDAETSARAVADFLRTGNDAITDQRFVVGPEGTLSGMPTLRAALLNWLPALDPEIALDVARSIIRATDSPDEYALALRNVAWNDLDGDLHPELSAAFQNMLARGDWRTRPTAGYLEAFDLAVELCDPHTFSRLADLAAQDSNPPSIIHAACMSMDRMILRDPALLSSAWESQPQWLDPVPMQRASLMSRLEIAREDHRRAFLSYLSSPRVNIEERDYFNSLFPNGNHLHGHRLVTIQEASPTIDQRAAMDSEVLHLIDQLLAAAPASAADSLRKIRKRLGQFVGSPP